MALNEKEKHDLIEAVSRMSFQDIFYAKELYIECLQSEPALLIELQEAFAARHKELKAVAAI
jgi:hypothetical protein